MFKSVVIFGVSLLLSLVSLEAQTIEKKKGMIAGKPYSYHVMQPSQPAKGIVLLMPSRNETPKKLFAHTAIPRHLAAHGFITIVPELDYTLIAERKTMDILDDLAANELGSATSPVPLFLGGFSSGGTIAAHYAEYRIAQTGEKSVNGLFLIDPPLDLARLHNAWTKTMNTSCPKTIISESKFIKTYVESVTGGTPKEKSENYLKLSAFSATDSLGGNAKFLKSIPVRLYTEPDLKSVQDKYCAELSYENLNSTDLDAMDDCLKKMGNSKVEYIRTTGRGTHSWNIVDAEDLATWVERITSE
jgi:hypothetical protein